MIDVAVVAPHPDDEVFGLGGIMRCLVDRGDRVRLVAVTDGELAFGAQSVAASELLVQRRHDERAEALDRLGIGSRVEIVRLGLPDGSVAAHEDALCDRLVVLGGDVVFATHSGDGHPDHEAVGRAVARATLVRQTRLIEYVVWGSVRDLVADVPVLRVRLDEATHAAKRHAVQAFRSQIEPSPDGNPVVSDALIRQASSNVELVVV